MTGAGAVEGQKADGHDHRGDREEGRQNDVPPLLPRLVHEAMINDAVRGGPPGGLQGYEKVTFEQGSFSPSAAPGRRPSVGEAGVGERPVGASSGGARAGGAGAREASQGEASQASQGSQGEASQGREAGARLRPRKCTARSQAALAASWL
ncbi:hypothetical protein GCM10018952_13080 [Streptosporangium vulgare]